MKRPIDRVTEELRAQLDRPLTAKEEYLLDLTRPVLDSGPTTTWENKPTKYPSKKAS